MKLPVLCTALGLAALMPSLWAANLPPSPTLLNQAAAWGCWGLVATYATRSAVLSLPLAASRSAPLGGALLLVALGALGAWLFGAMPAGLAWSGAGTVLGAVGSPGTELEFAL